jgi:hypothetical protein
VAPVGWIDNGAGGWTAPDGSHWGAREQPPLKLANDKWSQQRALEKREERLRHSNSEHPDEHESSAFDEEGDDTITPQQRKADHREWYTERYGDLFKTIRADAPLQILVEDGFVVKHRCRTYDGDCETAVNRRTPSPETHASAEDSPPTPDEGISEVTLGTYGDGPLEVRSGVVAPAGYYRYSH